MATMKTVLHLFVLSSLLLLVSCGGGGGGSGGLPPGTSRSVTLAWAPNHESGVNSAGGGYQVSISGQPTLTVPYVSGPATTPTSTTVMLNTGTYTVTVRAYAALDAQGGVTGSISAASLPLTVIVP